MGLFKSKQQKEIEKKMLVKRTINTMNKQINKLEDQKQMFIDAAKRAKEKSLDAQFKLALPWNSRCSQASLNGADVNRRRRKFRMGILSIPAFFQLMQGAY